MGKKELVAQLAERMGNVEGFGIAAATRAVENIVAIIADTLVRGDAITLRGFATLETVTRKPRKARHIKNAVIIDIPARRNVRIKLHSGMRERLNN